jgi:predicted MFS family arabinose efflux permease
VSRFVEESRDAGADGRVDIRGALLCVAALGGPVFALIEQPLYGWTDPVVLAPLAAGVACAGAFVWWERHAPAPMLDLSLFRNRNFTVTNVATLAIYGGLSATTFFVVLFLQQVAGYTALQAGLALMPITVEMFVLSRRTGALAERVGPRLPMTAGPLVAGGGLLLLSGVGRDLSYARDVLPGVLVFGLGLSLTVAPLTATVLSAVDQRHAGIASGVNNAVARMAGLIALAAVGAVVAGSYGNALDERVHGLRLVSGSEQALAEARRSPLIGSRSPEIDAPLGPAVDRASEHAFHTGMVVNGVLVMLGGLMAGAGIRNARPAPAAVPT